MKPQCDAIFDHLKRKGSLTAVEALEKFGSWRLAARIRDLREQGYNIHTTMIETPTGKRVARYTYHAR